MNYNYKSNRSWKGQSLSFTLTRSPFSWKKYLSMEFTLKCLLQIIADIYFLKNTIKNCYFKVNMNVKN